MTYDLIVIGAGPGGYEVASEQARKGKNVAVVEKGFPGGTCLNRGCIPTKCLCAAAEMLNDIARRSSQFGIAVEKYNASYEAAVARSESVVEQLREGVKSLLGNCDYYQGTARILPDGTVAVGNESLSAEKVIIATGSEPSRLPVEGAELAMTSDDFLKLRELPRNLVIIGGGVVGLEFAYVANAYGVEVTVIEFCKEILPTFDAEISKRLRAILSKTGINYLTSSAVTSIAKDSSYRVSYKDKKGEIKIIDCDNVLMAVGRRSVLPDGLKEAGIEVDSRNFIVTDENMQTTRKGFYAVGDCNGRMMLAHAATAQARVAVGETINKSAIPAAVFTDPEVAMVGLTTEQCKERGIQFESRKALYRANGKALASGHEDGFVKILTDPETHKILGCHILGAHASDLIQEATLAISAGLTVESMSLETVHGHPTLAEIVASAI